MVLRYVSIVILILMNPFEPYLILLKERYFRHKDDYKYNHHNINHLLKTNTSYIDKYGNRYASAENYESSLRFLYKKLIRL